MWLKVLRFLGVQPLLPEWRSFQNQTDMCAGTLKNNTFILCLLSCRGRFVFRNLHVANFYQFYVKHVCCDLLISKNPNWKLMKRETSMRVVQQIGQVTTFKRVHEFNEKPTLLLGDPNVTLKTMRPRHTAPEVVRSSGIDVHTCGRFFCRGYIIASVSVGRFIYIYTLYVLFYTPCFHVQDICWFVKEIVLLLWLGMMKLFQELCIIMYCGITNMTFLLWTHYQSTQPPQTLPIWRITPLSKWLVKGYTKPFITKPYSGDLLPMILNHLHVMGWSSR